MHESPTRTLDQGEVEAAVATANLPAMLMTIYQFTGDERWLTERYRPTRGRGLGTHDTGGFPPDVQAEIRAAAVPVILAMQSGSSASIPTLSPERTAELLTFYLGEQVDERYGPMIAAELARRSATGAATIETLPVKAPAGYRVILIGLGVAGIAGGHYLNQMDLDYTIFERRPAAGGVWFDNTYPGAGVDTPSHLYSFSFFDRDWTRHFALQEELHGYFTDAVDELGIREHVRFETEVVNAVLDESTLKWTVEVRNADGTLELHVADIVISAVGSLNIPQLPDLVGMDDFAGMQFHSSRWPAGLDVQGKRVAIVGTGASAQQIAPRIAKVASELVVFQRSPQWVAPFEQFGAAIDPGERTLLAVNRLYHAWYWVRLFWNFGDKVIEALRVDPKWEHPERAVNSRNDGHRKLFTKYIEEQLGDRQDLLPSVLPDYPPFGKRILLDNGWYDALKLDTVRLVTEHVASVAPDGPVSESGEVFPVDVIIWATGFKAAHFLGSLDVVGVGGRRLRDQWDDDDPRGYLGTSIPGFPNFFTLGGPHSFPGSGSFMYSMEVQGRYLRDLITRMLDRGVVAIDPLPEVTERYNDLVDDVHSRTVWTHPGFGTYYRNSKGRVIFVMPFLNREYWEFTRRPDLENYVFRYRDGSVRAGADTLADPAHVG